MDAKAKVVAWELRYLPPVGDWSRWMPSSQYAYDNMLHYDNALETEYRALIPLTDHEAALAELTADRDSWMDQASQRLADWEAVFKKHERLLTGLEALAGEWEKKRRQFTVQGHAKKETYAKCAAELRTLASAGLEGKTL